MAEYGYNDGENSVGGECGRKPLCQDDILRIGKAIGGHSHSWLCLLQNINEPVYSRKLIDNMYSKYLLTKCNFLVEERNRSGGANESKGHSSPKKGQSTQRSNFDVDYAGVVNRVMSSYRSMFDDMLSDIKKNYKPNHQLCQEPQPCSSLAYQADNCPQSTCNEDDDVSPECEEECEECSSTTTQSGSCSTSSSTSSSTPCEEPDPCSSQAPTECDIECEPSPGEGEYEESSSTTVQSSSSTSSSSTTLQFRMPEDFYEGYSDEEVWEEQSLVFEDEGEPANFGNGGISCRKLACKQFVGQDKKDECEEDKGPVPLSLKEIIDIVLDIDIDADDFQEMMVHTKLPVYSEEQIRRIYEEYMQTFKSPSEIFEMAKKIGGEDEEWLNMVKVLHGTLDCRNDLVDLFEGYKVRLEERDRTGDGYDVDDMCGSNARGRNKTSCFKLPSEEDPFSNCGKPEDLGYLIKK